MLGCAEFAFKNSFALKQIEAIFRQFRSVQAERYSFFSHRFRLDIRKSFPFHWTERLKQHSHNCCSFVSFNHTAQVASHSTTGQYTPPAKFVRSINPI
jgi:hypothetical protein